ncbi:transcription factor IIIB 60 kDa subunit isoform X2 [Tripterygium wilfordii]|uniref:transcription factor IIIB 60 kDa subunit isoform X2 n=1 Tax=Tripterygium wilfordii TaxID=458696 RepID=UPI0018F8222E|nr:transcription factor IIIB 60 kDa subunit isoform X2 [Tripterygium wilfordii]
MSTWCSNCSKTVRGERYDGGPLCCTVCGKVLEDTNFSSEVTFTKDSYGQSRAVGNVIRSVESDGSASRQMLLERARNDIRILSNNLEMDDYAYADVIEMAWRFYTMAVERNFTRGRRTNQVQAACLYIACRQKRKPYLLIDFSNELQINIYVLGAVFLELCKVLYLVHPSIFLNLVDPSIFIEKFTQSLLGKEDRKRNVEVAKTAESIMASMKRDWITTGRKPSGLCGAALYISALSHGIKCLKSDIIEEFMEKAYELRESASTKLPNVAPDLKEVLCPHKKSQPFACQLCKSCYDEFMKVSGGLDGGVDPPAFQRAERERMAIAQMEKESVESEPTPEGLVNSEQIEKEPNIPHTSKPEKLFSESKMAGDVPKAGATHDLGSNMLDEVDGGAESCDESDNFSDIDDVEVDGYLHNEEEKQYKKIIWEEMNREYLEEQAAKEAAAAVAKQAYDANIGNCPEGLQAARDFAAATEAAVQKSRKEKQQRRATEAKNSLPAQSAAEATHQMLIKKRLSSKINYDVLEKLFDEPAAQQNPKKSRSESHLNNDGKLSNIDNKARESEGGNKDDDLMLEDEYDYQEDEYDVNNDYNYDNIYEGEDNDDNGYD